MDISGFVKTKLFIMDWYDIWLYCGLVTWTRRAIDTLLLTLFLTVTLLLGEIHVGTKL